MLSKTKRVNESKAHVEHVSVRNLVGWLADSEGAMGRERKRESEKSIACLPICSKVAFKHVIGIECAEVQFIR